MEVPKHLRIGATTRVWFGVTPYRCEWAWNIANDMIYLERATGPYGSVKQGSKKHLILWKKALADPIDRARLEVSLSQDPNSPRSPEAKHLATLKMGNYGLWFGLVVYVGMLSVVALLGSWVEHHLGKGAADLLIVVPAMLGPLVISPASDWFVSHFHKDGPR